MNQYSILIIDDCEEDRYLLKRYLKSSALDTTIAETENGEEALNFLTRFGESVNEHSELKAPLVVFLDINMPIMNGWEFLQAFQDKQEQIQISPVVIVMFSTSDNIADKARISEFEAVKYYIVKGSHTVADLENTIVACVEAA